MRVCVCVCVYTHTHTHTTANLCLCIRYQTVTYFNTLYIHQNSKVSDVITGACCMSQICIFNPASKC